MRSLLPCLALALLAAFGRRCPAQDDVGALAKTIVQALAPASDAPDALAAQLVAAALAQPRSPAACFLIEAVIRNVSMLQQPAALRDALGAGDQSPRRHGLLELRLAELRWLLDRATAGIRAQAPGTGPFAGFATEVLVAGPFGDAGDHFTGVVFAPELAFPAAGSELPGRGATATVRTVRRKPEQRRLQLTAPAQNLQGCWYALHRVHAAVATTGFLEVENDGAFQVFVDDVEQLRVEPWLAPGPARRYVPLQLAAGEHRAVVKTCSNEHAAVALRWVDGEGGPLAGLTEVAPDAAAGSTGAPATAGTTPFVTALDAFAGPAAADGATPTLRIAAMKCAAQQGADDLALSLQEALRDAPTQDPVELLAWAEVLSTLPLPDELRAAEARSLEERALETLPKDHHHGRIAAARLLQQQDRAEDALLLLAQGSAPGPATFAFRSSLLRRLRFDDEEVPLLRAWRAACPADPRPLVTLAAVSRAAGDPRAAMQLLQQAVALRPDHLPALRQTFDLALDLGDAPAALAAIDRLAAVGDGASKSLERLRLERRLANRTGNLPGEGELLAAIAAHADADVATLQQVAAQQADAGAPAAAAGALRRCLALDADLPATRAWLAELGEGPADGADFAAFRRDGDAARGSFAPAERETTATSTLVIDQRIVEFRTDGSWLAEVHELRAINDLTGVEEFRTASAPAAADEVLLVRTIAKDGRAYVPLKVENDYALQRLEPGVFVEWRYRERGPAPGPDALQAERFYFRSSDAPCLLTELIVILPASHRGELRSRDLPAPTSRQELADGRVALRFTRQDVPRLPQERFVPSLGEVAAFAQFGEDRPPFATLRETRVQLLRRSHPTPVVHATAQRLFAELAGDREKLQAAAAYAQSQIEAGPAESASHALLRKKGNRFLVVVALLRAAGMRVDPTACLPQRPDLGDGDDELFEDGNQHTLPGALVTLADGSVEHLFVDAPRHWPLGAVPAGRARSAAYVVRSNGVEAIELPDSRDAVQTLRIAGKATVADGDLQLAASARIGDTQGWSLAERIRELKEDVRKLAARQIAQQMFPGWRVRAAQVVLDRPAEGFLLTMELSRTCVQQDGDRWRVPLPMAPGKFLATYGDRAERTLPFWLGHEMIQEWDFVLEPGPERCFAEVPPPTSLRHRGFVHLLTFAVEAGGLRIRRTTRIEPTALPAAQFGDWLQALSAADRADQTSVLLKSRAK